MYKFIRQAKSFISATRSKLKNKDLKNLKISPDVHQRLKVQAAQYGIPISEFADIMLALALSESKAWQDLKDDALKERLGQIKRKISV